MKLERTTNITIGPRQRVNRHWLGVVLATVAASVASPAHSHELPATFDLAGTTIERPPALFKFQARVSQGGTAIGTASFTQVYVTILDNTSGLTCSEQFQNVKVRSSVLNLTVGRNMSCDVDAFIRQANDLSFKVCLESETNCLKPIAIGSVPYATKASYAHQAVEATRADVAAQSHYAHRITADPSMIDLPQVGTGFFDFHTPPDAPGAGGTVYADAEYSASHTGDGFLQWAGTGATSRLNICAKELIAGVEGAIQPLDELVAASTLTTMTGSATIKQDATVGGHHSVDGGISVGNNTGIGNGIAVTEGASVAGGLTVTKGTAAQALAVTGETALAGGLWVGNATPPAMAGTLGLTVEDGADVNGGLTVTGGSTTLDVNGAADVSDGLTVAQGTAASALTVSGSASVTGQLTVTSQSGSRLVADGPAEFNGDATFGSGTTVAVNGNTVHAGTVNLNGPVTTAYPIPNVVENAGVGTPQLQDAAVTNAKLDLTTPNPDASVSSRYCSPSAPVTIAGTWQACMLTEVQVSNGNGQCKVYREENTSTGQYEWKLSAAAPAGSTACCSVNCF